MTLRLDAVRVGYAAGLTTLVHPLSLSLRGGELAVLLGPSGCGKSTLLRAVSGFRRGRGAVYLCDRPLYDEFEGLKRRIGFVPQDDILQHALTVEQTFRYAAQLRLGADWPAARQKAQVASVLRAVALEERAHLKVSRLSGGQRKRVSVGVELFGEPNLFFLDEPTSGLDPGLEDQAMRLYRKLTGPSRITLVTTHVMASLDVADLVIILVKGHLAFFGPPLDALGFLGVDDFAGIYRRLSEADGSTFARRYVDSRFFGEYVSDRLRQPRQPLTPLSSESTMGARVEASGSGSGSASAGEPGRAGEPGPEEILARLKRERKG